MKKIILVASMLFWLAINPGIAQNPRQNSIPLIGDIAPSFTAESTNGTINFPEDFGRSWKILFAHPRDFTPVCSSELLELAFAESEFEKLGAKLVVMSTDILDSHFAWKEALEEIPYRGRQPVTINFPLVDDSKYNISDMYGMTHPSAKKGANIRGVFFIDRENRVRAIFFYPSEVGRSTDEILRTLIALQRTDDNFAISTPANWKPGEPLMVPYPNPLMLENMRSATPIYFQYSWFMTFTSDMEKED